MDFRKAIQRVSKVLPKGKTNVLRKIRFLEPMDGAPSLVYATDGVVASVVYVDEALPTALVDADVLVQAAKDCEELKIVKSGYGNLLLESEVSTYTLGVSNADDYPMVFQLPRDWWTTVENWNEVTPAFHAARKTKTDSDLESVIYFDREYVESTDTGRLARVWSGWPCSGYVPPAAFKSWPRGKVSVGHTLSHIYFRIGDDEFRLAAFSRPTGYPSTVDVVPRSHPGSSVLVPTRLIKNIVEQATSVSTVGIIHLRLDDAQMRVTSCDNSGDPTEYSGVVNITDIGSSSVGMLLNGKHLVAALKLCKTYHVKLGWGTEINHPLRVDSNHFTTVIWPMVKA